MNSYRGVFQVLLSTIVMVVVFFVTNYASAQTPVPAASPVPAKAEEKVGEAKPVVAVPVKKVDYSGGFQKFYKLGLPNVKGAKYVKLDMYANRSYSSGGLYDLRLSGNAWMIEENEEGPSKFVTENGMVVEVYDQKKLQKIILEEQKKKAEEDKDAKKSSARYQMYGQDEKGRIGGKWKEVDLAKDVKKTIAYLKKKSKDENSIRRFSYSSSYGTLFLTCIHYHSQGYKDEANEIAGILFEMSKDRRKVIIQGLNSLADSNYEQVMNKFLDKGDWNVLVTDLTGLLRRYTVGWKKGLVVKRLYENAKKRVAQPKPPAIAGLSAENQALADELAAIGKLSANRGYNRYRLYGSEIWVLAKQKKSKKKVDDEKPNVIQKIKDDGMKSVPLLIALLSDEYMTKLDMEAMGGGRSYYSSNRGGTMTEEKIAEMYKNLRRPVTRGEIAFKLLESLPLSDDDRSSDWENSEELAEACKEWYEENKAKTVMELAKIYMDSPSSQQRRSAIQFLTRYGGDAETAMLESAFLDSERADRDMHLLQQYVERRQDKAKDFVAKYEANLKKQMEDSESDMFKNDNYKEQMEKQLKQLKDIVSAPPASDILASLLTGKKKLKDESTALRRGLSKMKPDEVVGFLLEGALKAKDVELRKALVGMVGQAKYMRHYAGRYGMEDEEEDEEPELNIKTHEASWKKLLADKTEVKDRYWATASGKVTIAQSASWVIETLFTEDNGSSARIAKRALGEDVLVLLEKRAAERMQGKEEDDLTKFPSADNVSEERVKKIVAELKSAQGDSLVKAIEAISADERLALGEAFDDEEALNAKLASYVFVVRDVNVELDDEAKTASFKALKGKRVNKAILESLKKTSEEIVKSGNVATVSIVRRACLNGVVVTVKEVKPGDEHFERMTQYYGRQAKKGKAIIQGGINGGEGLYANVTWNVEVEVAESNEVESEKAGDDELEAMLEEELDMIEVESEDSQVEARELFWKTSDELLKGKGNVCKVASVYFSGIPLLPESKDEDKDE